jgi:hypothetical protein
MIYIGIYGGFIIAIISMTSAVACTRFGRIICSIIAIIALVLQKSCMRTLIGIGEAWSGDSGATKSMNFRLVSRICVKKEVLEAPQVYDKERV